MQISILLFSHKTNIYLSLISNAKLQLVIDKYNFHHVARNYLLKYFATHASDQQQEFLLVTIFEKWSSFFENLLTSEDFYQNGLLVTDFLDFIINYYTLIQSDREVIILVKNLLLKINFIDTEWAISKSRQLTKYHLYMSHLYLLSYAYQHKKLIDKEIINLFTDMKKNKIQFQRYFIKESSAHFNIIDENLNWLSY